MKSEEHNWSAPETSSLEALGIWWGEFAFVLTLVEERFGTQQGPDIARS